MFLDWKNWYCYSVHTTQSDLQIQCGPYQNSNGIFHRNRKKIPKIHMEAKKTPIAKAILRKMNKVDSIIFLISNYITKLQ